jgi:hypothetical protein
MRQKILILSYSDFDKDPRIIRQIEALKDQYELIQCGVAPNLRYPSRFVKINGYTHLKYNVPEQLTFHLQYPTPLRKIISLVIGKPYYRWVFPTARELNRKREIKSFHTNDYGWRYWAGNAHVGSPSKIVEIFGKEPIDVIIANDIDTLPIALGIAKRNKAKVLFDAHEYHPKEIEDNEDWVRTEQPYKTWLCKEYIPQVDCMTTVCEGIAQEYAKNFGVTPEVITNATSFYDLTPTITNEKHIKLIHHGICSPSRKIELMIEMMNYLDDRFSLDLILVHDIYTKAYYDKLIESVKHNKKIQFKPPVPTSEIPIHTNQYDIGVFILKPVNLNYHYALPNKFFEFVQARLAIAIAPSPEMTKYIQKYDVGIVAEDYTPQSLAAKLNALTHTQIMYYKQQAHQHAHELSADINKKRINTIVNRLLNTYI